MAALPFLEARISDDIARGMTRTKFVPGRTMLRSPNGGLNQNYTAALPILKYDLAHGIKRASQYSSVEDLWYVVHFGSGGPYSGFLVKDFGDFRLTQTNSRLTLITGAIYQINRVHAYGGLAEFLRPILKPDANIVVKRTRSGVVTTATATVDTTTGQATISGHAGGDTYTCEGTFHMPVTFSEDEWDCDIIGGDSQLVVVSGSIKVEEIRPTP